MKKPRNLITIILISAIFITFLSITCTKKPKEIKIGAILPLTGENAIDGDDAKLSIDLALKERQDELNQKDIRLRVIYEDDKMDPKEGVNAATKVIKVDKVVSIIGPFGSSVLLSVAPMAERNKVVLISGSATNPKIKEAGDYIFRVVPPDDYQGKTLSKFAFQVLKSNKAAIIFMNNDYGVGLKSVIEREFPEFGGKILTVEGFNPGDTDFRAQVQKVKIRNPQCIFMPSHHTEGALVLRQAWEMGLQVPFLGGDGIFRPELIKIAGNAAENTYVSAMSWRPDSPNLVVQIFVKKFKEAYGRLPNVFSAYYYDATNIILDCILLGAATSDEIKESLYKMSFQGVTGRTKFDKFGEVEKPIDIYRIEDSKFKYVYTIQP